MQDANRAIEEEIKAMHTKLVEMGVSRSSFCNPACGVLAGDWARLEDVEARMRFRITLCLHL